MIDMIFRKHTEYCESLYSSERKEKSEEEKQVRGRPRSHALNESQFDDFFRVQNINKVYYFKKTLSEVKTQLTAKS